MTHGSTEGATRLDSTNAPASWTLPRAILVAAPVLVFFAAMLMIQWDFTILFSDPVFPTLMLLGWPFAIVLAFKSRPWVYLTQGILAALMPLMVTGMFGWFVLMNPLHGTPAIGATLFALTFLVTLPTGILAFRRLRKGGSFPGFKSAFRTRLGIYVTALALFFVGSAFAGSLAATNAKDVAGGGYDFAVEKIGGVSIALPIEDFEFARQTFDVTAGTVTEIVVENRDGELHTFTYEVGGTEYDHQVLPGSTSSFLVLFDNPGTIKFRCTPHSSSYDDDPEKSMVGAMNVVAA